MNKIKESKTCGIVRLYRALYPDYRDYFNTTLLLSAEQIKAIEAEIVKSLNEREVEILTLHFGLDGNEPMLTSILAYRQHVTVERVRNIEAKALRKLRKAGSLPAIFEAPKDLKENVERLTEALEAFHKMPEFLRAQENERELQRLKRLPFKFAHGSVVEPQYTHLDELGLSIRTYNSLRHAGIATIYDIVSLPKQEWSRNRTLGQKGAQEVVEKMHMLGYEDFDIVYA